MSDIVSDYQWNFLLPDILLVKTERNDMLLYLYFYFIILWLVIWLLTLIFYFKKLNSQQIRVRTPIFTVLSSLSGHIMLCLTYLEISKYTDRYPCVIELWSNFLLYPSYITPFILRYFKYYMLIKEFVKWREGRINNPRESPLVSDFFWITVFLIFLSISLLNAVFISPLLFSDWVTCYGCQYNYVAFWTSMIIYIIAFISIAILYKIGREVDDTYKMKNEMILSFVLFFLFNVPYSVLSYIFPYSQLSYSFLRIAYIVYSHMISVVWPLFLSFKRPPIFNTPESILETIEEITLDPDGYKLIEQVADKHHSSEIPPFLLKILEYRNLKDIDIMKREARIIFDSFMRPGSAQWNNLPQAIVNDVESRLNNPTSDLFNQPYRELLKLLKTNFLDEIKSLPEYTKLLTQKKKQIDQHRRTIDFMHGNV